MRYTLRLLAPCPMAATVSLALLACRKPPVDECQELVNAARWQEAAAVCQTALARGGDPRAGALAARAHYALGNETEVRDLLERLRGTTAEHGVLMLAGDQELQRGDRETAKAQFQRSLELAQDARDPRGTAQAADRLFYLAWEDTEPRRALQFAVAAFEAAETTGDDALRFRAALALHSAFSGLGDVAGAGRALERAIDLRAGQGDSTAAYLFLNLGDLRLEQGRMALSRQASQRALELAGEGTGPRFLRSARLNLVEASLAVGDLAAAEEHLAAARASAEGGIKDVPLLYCTSRFEHARGREESALEAAATALALGPSSEWRWRLLLHRGAVEEAQGRGNDAEQSYRKAAEIVEATRDELGFEEFKTTLLDARRRPFEALFRLQAQTGRLREALETVERATARSFLDALIRDTSTRSKDRTEDRSALAAADRAEALKSLLPVLSESPTAALQPVRSILEALGGRHALVFFEAEGRFWRLVAERSRLALDPLAAPAAEVDDLVEAYLEAPDARYVAESLGGLLLSPGSLPVPGQSIYVVPDGVLGRIPVAALRPGGRYVVEDHPVVYLPSLSALAATAGPGGAAAGPPVVLGDPRGDLEAASLEAREVAALLHTAPRTGSAASKAALEEAARATVLHLASHTGIGPRGPWLVMADGEVDVAFLLDRRIRPRLAVLATCASAARRGREMWGSLAAGFLAAGSPAVLASLHSVEDETARRMVLRFYAEEPLRDPALALARAQRAAIAAGEPPSSWAWFVLLGTR